MSFVDILSILEKLASIFTAIGIFLAWWQIVEARRQTRTQFEDGLAREYRDIARQLPVKALLGEELTAKEHEDYLHLLFKYIDLSNEQIFLRQNNRVSAETWQNWCDGIKSNLSRIAFKKAWEEIKLRAEDSFEELRRLEKSGFRDDPISWK